MIMQVLATKNKKSGQFGRFDLSVLSEDKDIIQQYSIAVLEADEKSLVLLKELELYKLGTFDTDTGLIDSTSPQFLLDLGSVSYGGKKD